MRFPVSHGRPTFLGVSLIPMTLSCFINMGLCGMEIIMIYQYITQHATWSSRLSIASFFSIVTHSYALLAASFRPSVLPRKPSVRLLEDMPHIYRTLKAERCCHG